MKLKPRGTRDHLTTDEIGRLMDLYVDRCPGKVAAHELNMSRRNVTKYFGLFKAEGIQRNQKV